MKRAASFVLAALLLASTARTASAQNEKALAKEAYDRGTQAHARGDFRRAAEEFAKADALAPSPVALQAALDAAVDADDFVLGADLLERTKRLGASRPGTLAASIDAATKKLGGRAGHVKVACPSGARCTATLDGAAFDAGKGVWSRVGPHTLVVQVDGAPDTRTVEVRAGEDMEVVAARAPPRPLPRPPPPDPDRTRPPPRPQPRPRPRGPRKRVRPRQAAPAARVLDRRAAPRSCSPARRLLRAQGVEQAPELRRRRLRHRRDERLSGPQETRARRRRPTRTSASR